jgi:opacity protein-like surface antigen
MRASLRLLVASLALATLPGFARAGGLVSLDGMSSTVMQEGQSSFSGVALRARLHPQRLVQAVELMPTFEYWRSSNTVAPYGIETMRKDATLGLDARYTFHNNGWKPYIGAGFAVHFLTTRVNAPSLGLVDATDSVIKGGLAALGGVSFGLSERVDNFLELKYHHVTDYRQLKINWGLSYRL